MSLIRTFTVTVVSTGGGNKYFLDGVQQPTISLAEGYTYKFDQSDSSNGTGGTHPLRFLQTIIINLRHLIQQESLLAELLDKQELTYKLK